MQDDWRARLTLATSWPSPRPPFCRRRRLRRWCSGGNSGWAYGGTPKPAAAKSAGGGAVTLPTTQLDPTLVDREGRTLYLDRGQQRRRRVRERLAAADNKQQASGRGRDHRRQVRARPSATMCSSTVAVLPSRPEATVR